VTRQNKGRNTPGVDGMVSAASAWLVAGAVSQTFIDVERLHG
jgi:hypothetical protein